MQDLAVAVMQGLALAERELLLFAGIFFIIGALDELAIDISWAWLWLRGPARTRSVDRASAEKAALKGHAAVFIPAWSEAQVIGTTIAHLLKAWPQAELRLFVGVYANDPATLEAALEKASGDPRLRLVVLDNAGPTSKADCLNRLYAAMQAEQARHAITFRQVLLHDAEDMVDPAVLALIDRALETADFVQIPVQPLPQRASRWIGSHYCEEFAEAHAKAMVVRDAFGAALPAAGVGCAFTGSVLARLAKASEAGPFDQDSLTEDYELGLRVRDLGGTGRFLRLRGDDGELVATRAYFPAALPDAVRQKARWVHGIALQGWDRMGWGRGPLESWMRMRDRRGPMVALVLFLAYLLVAVAGLASVLRSAGYAPGWEPTTAMWWLLAINVAMFGWRALMRFAFTAREYGAFEGLRAVLRLPVANIIAIMAGRRAVFAYARTLRGGPPLWEKTHHPLHPAMEAKPR
ncbi:glycosyl transferase family protein [Paraurantiacibacter namhicola]|uniref:Bacteriophage N4 adsorption protein B n=1 Tax=Paraurantiacibacter namhicola TaxID=645517 RepID=A0A1C7DBF6_9SPHN|nr:glycosyl transferase family protein [Paraurantiacibacter namhicola]ANU08641.1 bacteriophage N4 adsorption protein B [Paraurantiacibacter namhicola]